MRNVRILYILPFLLLFLLGGCAPAQPDGPAGGSSSSSASSEEILADDLPAGDFVYNETSNPYGTVYVRGFASVGKISEPFCETDCKTYDFVSFSVVESGNEDFQKFLNAQQGNQVINPPKIGLGCVESGVISYTNHSDKYNYKDFILSESISEAILQSSFSKPVTLKLTKEQLSGGGGAPACYSHFTEVSLWGTSNEPD